eukprot:gb/GECH01003218.1/.p1 GENE.gb/GECH01003218.1/~~gb/GECH01003218.1/.p1  ORF type:complete len:452 (+),score=93.50 gb/GECH01003218.1/:1-1356(+)
MSAEQTAVVAGGGLCGSLAAIFLAKRGFNVEIFERRSDSRVDGINQGRSINLALSERGLNALRQAGVDNEILSNSIKMKGRQVHDIRGNTRFQAYDIHGKHLLSVSRQFLNEHLISEAEKLPNITTHFEYKCTGAEIRKGAINFKKNDGNEERRQPSLVVGADGAFSAVRSSMQRTDRFQYSQEFLTHGYKELCIPRTSDGEFAMEPEALHIWPRNNFMMIALPNPDKSFTCTLFMAFENGDQSFDKLQNESQVLEFFKNQFPDAVPLMPTLVEDFFRNPTSSLVTIRCHPFHKNNFVLLGDSAHAIVPFYGQGCNCAFEDCFVFDQLFDQYNGNLNQVLEEYSKQRKADVDTIADLALYNYLEMRDHTASFKFLLKKKLEHVLHWFMPKTFIPLYTYVSFTNVPYSLALRTSDKQSRYISLVTRIGLCAALFGVVVSLSNHRFGPEHYPF